MYYVMVTDWDDHWAKLLSGKATYTQGMLMGLSWGKWVEGMGTVFIRHYKDSDKVDAWVGTVSQFVAGKPANRDKETVRFCVNIEAPCEVPVEYKGLASGWYLVEGETDSIKRLPTRTSQFDPPFVATLRTTSDWKELERHTPHLLKLLGIHSIYPIPDTMQRGRPDGLFKLKSLAVIYDCTLEPGFEDVKRDQIANYCAMLRKGTLGAGDASLNVADCSKQVWVITRGQTHKLRQEDDVSVREVAIATLLGIYHKRMLEDIDEDDLVELLKRA